MSSETTLNNSKQGSTKKERDCYMRQALDLAKLGLGRTSPNPMVGALVVKNGRVVGSGYHEKYGDAHAEINAMKDAGSGNCKHATLYVSLEPCSTFGKTPPCTESIIQSGFDEVVIGSIDPNPQHSGRGVKILKDAGIKVEVGVLSKLADALNEAFFFKITEQRPFILLKMAMTLDGKTATPNGESKWITAPSARERVQELRRWADAIMIGSGTAKHDHPSLNVRKQNGEIDDSVKQPMRIIVSSTISEKDAPNILSQGKSPIVINPKSYHDWLKVLSDFSKNGVNSILLEGGACLAGELLKYKLINKIEFHIAPKILGGFDSVPVVQLPNPENLADSLLFKSVQIKTIGQDVIYSAYPDYR